MQYYVGESDNVRKRLAKHITDANKRFHGHVCAVLLAGLSHGEKSTAKKAEALTIQALLRQVRVRACEHMRARVCMCMRVRVCVPSLINPYFIVEPSTFQMRQTHLNFNRLGLLPSLFDEWPNLSLQKGHLVKHSRA